MSNTAVTSSVGLCAVNFSINISFDSRREALRSDSNRLKTNTGQTAYITDGKLSSSHRHVGVVNCGG